MKSTKSITLSIIEDIKNGAFVVTVNKRLSGKLVSQYEEGLINEGKSGWTTPPVYSIDRWFEDLWNDYTVRGGLPLLSPSRSKSLFHKIVKEDNTISGLGPSLRGIARSAYRAMKEVNEYSINIEGGVFVTKEVASYLRWSEEYKKRVLGLNLTDPIMVRDKVIGLIKDGLIDVPGKVIFVGFDDMTPKVKKLIEVLGSAGSEVLLLNSNLEIKDESLEFPKNIKGYSFKTQSDEVTAVAREIRNKYREGKKIGIIVPDMEQYKDLIMREFSSELNPLSILPGEENYDSFNISLGNSLSSEVIVKTALDILSVDSRKQNVEDLINILSNPYISDSNEYSEVMDLDLALRKENYLKITLNKLDEKISKDKSVIKNKIQTWINFIESNKGSLKYKPSKWSEKFSEFLEELGWANIKSGESEVKLTDNESEAVRSWIKVLGELATLDDILGDIPIKTALSELTSMVGDTKYQVETPDCEIEVMGMLESSGIYFDHIWVMGAHRESLPFKPTANPFIPFYKQREAGITQSSYEGTVLMAKAILKRIFCSAEEFTVSYPEEFEGRPVSISPFFRDLQTETIENSDGSRLFDALRDSIDIEDMAEEPELPVLKGELKSISKGTGVIKNHSDCPFRSFAINRLRAESLNCPEPGLNAMDKGTVIHDALKLFWNDVGDSKGLKSLYDKGTLSSAINKSVEVALKKKLPWSRGRYFKMEAERVSAILELWLKEELERGDFKVKSLESSESLDLGGFILNVKIDRVDELEDGTKAVIDYKTGVCNKNDWLTSRPREPQMPIYSMTSEFDAVAFASLKIDKAKFVGSSKNDGALPGVKGFDSDSRWTEKIEGVGTWDELRKSWRETLINIGADFIKGNIDVNPNNVLTSNSACKYCDVKPLCRIFELYIEEVED